MATGRLCARLKPVGLGLYGNCGFLFVKHKSKAKDDIL